MWALIHLWASSASLEWVDNVGTEKKTWCIFCAIDTADCRIYFDAFIIYDRHAIRTFDSQLLINVGGIPYDNVKTITIVKWT